MSDASNFDAVIAAAEKVEAPAVEAEIQASEEAQPAVSEGEQPAAPEPEVAFPKKAVNAISRRDKQIGKLKAQHEAAMAELAKYRQLAEQPKAKPSEDKGPQEADFQGNYGEYLEARAEWRALKAAEKAINENGQKQHETQQSQEEQRWVAHREETVAAQAREFIKENPEAQQLLDEHADVIDDYSPELQRIFLEADNAPLAFVNLAKEGKLEALATMPLAKAAMEIGRAQYAAPAPKPITKAPAPLTPAKGSAPGAKTLDHMSPDELRAWRRG